MRKTKLTRSSFLLTFFCFLSFAKSNLTEFVLEFENFQKSNSGVYSDFLMNQHSICNVFLPVGIWYVIASILPVNWAPVNVGLPVLLALGRISKPCAAAGNIGAGCSGNEFRETSEYGGASDASDPNLSVCPSTASEYGGGACGRFDCGGIGDIGAPPPIDGGFTTATDSVGCCWEPAETVVGIGWSESTDI